MSEEEEKNIWAGLRRREKQVLTFLFNNYYEKLYFFAKKYIYDANKAHDIVQDVFVRLWENADKLMIHTTIHSYLFTSIRNACLNYLRDLKIEDCNNRKYAEAYIESHNIDMVEDEEMLEKIRSILKELPDKCREICLLRFVDGYKYAEIAKQLNISENTVKVQLHRGVERVKQAFSDREGMLVWLTLWQIYGD